MASICHISLLSDVHSQQLFLCSTAMAAAIMPSPTIVVRVPCSCQSPVPRSLQKHIFLKMCGTYLLSLLNWRIIFCLKNHYWVYTFRKIISLSLCYMFCLKHAWYAFGILIRLLICIIQFFLPKVVFLTGLLGRQKDNLRKYHSHLSL